jgi:hypothetical protein
MSRGVVDLNGPVYLVPLVGPGIAKSVFWRQKSVFMQTAVATLG